MRLKYLLIAGVLIVAFLKAEMLYTDRYMQSSGVVAEPIATGIPNTVDGNRLLHWGSYVVRLAPLHFNGTRLNDDSEYALEQLRELISQNRSRIRYIALIGHCSAVEDEENRIALGGWSAMWQSVGGKGTLPREKAIEMVNERLRMVYDEVRSAGVPSSRIYNENRLDKDPLFTEATSKGRSLNNRVDVALFSTGPLVLADLRIQFALDSARILPEYDERVANFAKLLKKNPSMRTTIVGHTDRRGSYSYNIALSKRRAEAVKARLVELGIRASSIRTEGRGYTEPIASGHNEAAYRQNRRIEAKLYR